MATPPDFVAGQVLTAAQMNKIGLWLVSNTTVAAGASSHAVTGCFSADYDAYLVQFYGGAGSTSAAINLTLGSTATGYYYGLNTMSYASAAGAVGGANATSFAFVGYMSTAGVFGTFNLFNPFATDETYLSVQMAYPTTTGFGISGGGYLANQTSYTGFTLTPASGTFGSTKVLVYGYNNN